MADSELKVNIKSTADTSGIDKIDDSLKQLKTSATEATQSTEGLGLAIGGALGVTAVGAVIGAFNAFLDLNEEVQKTAQNIKAVTDKFVEHTAAITSAAASVTRYNEALRIGAQAMQQMIAMHEKLNEAQNALAKGPGTFNTILEFLAKLGGAGKDAQPFTDALKLQVDLLQKLDERARYAAVALQLFAEEEASAAEGLRFAPVEVAIAKTTEKVRELGEQLGKINPRESDAEMQHWLQIKEQIASATRFLGEMIDKQKAQKDLLKQTEDQMRINNDAGDDELQIQDKVKQAYDAKLKALRAAGFEEQRALEIANAYAESVRHSLESVQGQDDAQSGLNEELTKARTILESIRHEQELTKENPFLGADQKQVMLIQQYREELAAVLSEMERLKALKSIDPAEIARANQEMLRLGFAADQLRLKLQAATHPLRAELSAWAQSFGTTMQQVGKTIESTIGTALEGINQWIVTGKFNLQSMMQQIELLGLKLIEQLILQRVMAMINAQANVAVAATTGPAIAAAFAPAATAVTIATEGQAALAAPSEYAAALFSIEAMAIAHTGGAVSDFKKFHGGGLAPDEVPIVAQEGEIIINREASAANEDLLLGINAGRFHDGGMISASTFNRNPGAWGIYQASGGGFNYYNPTTGQTLWAPYDYTNTVEPGILPGNLSAGRIAASDIGGGYQWASTDNVWGSPGSPSDYDTGSTGDVQVYIPTSKTFPKDTLVSGSSSARHGFDWSGWTIGGLTQRGIYIPGWTSPVPVGPQFRGGGYNPYGMYSPGTPGGHLPLGLYVSAAMGASTGGMMPMPGGMGERVRVLGESGAMGAGQDTWEMKMMHRGIDISTLPPPTPYSVRPLGGATAGWARSMARHQPVISQWRTAIPPIMPPLVTAIHPAITGPTGIMISGAPALLQPGGTTAMLGEFGSGGVFHGGRGFHRGGRVSRYHSGGTVAGNGNGAGGIHIYAFTDMKAMVRHMGSRDGQKIIFDTVKGNRIDLGMR